MARQGERISSSDFIIPDRFFLSQLTNENNSSSLLAMLSRWEWKKEETNAEKEVAYYAVSGDFEVVGVTMWGEVMIRGGQKGSWGLFKNNCCEVTRGVLLLHSWDSILRCNNFLSKIFLNSFFSSLLANDTKI